MISERFCSECCCFWELWLFGQSSVEASKHVLIHIRHLLRMFCSVYSSVIFVFIENLRNEFLQKFSFEKRERKGSNNFFTELFDENIIKEKSIGKWAEKNGFERLYNLNFNSYFIEKCIKKPKTEYFETETNK